ncbi:MAG: Cof-type HAD-IIB family hydrolase [Turicibacter sp.]
MTKSLILFDIDGTLLQSDINQIPESTLLAISKLDKAGHDLGIATGRPLYLVDNKIKELPFNVFITSNGQHILYNNELIYENPIPKEVVQDLLEEAKKLEVPIGLMSSNLYTVTKETEEVKTSFERVSMPMPDLIPDLHEKESILQAWFFSDKFDALQQKYNKELRFYPWIEFGADIVPVNGSKAEGIKYLVSHLEEVPKRIITFGDGANDIEMLELADIGVAMGNASDAVKLKANFVTKSIDEDGVYHACQALELF